MKNWMSKIATCLVAVSIVACGEVPEPDGSATQPDESFMTAGKADGMTVSEQSPEAAGILALVNEASFEVLDDSDHVGLDIRAAYGIVTVREKAPIASLEQLDAVPWVGRRAFKKLYRYALEHGYIATEGEVTPNEGDDATQEPPEVPDTDQGPVDDTHQEPRPPSCESSSCPLGSVCSTTADRCEPVGCSWEAAFAERYGQDFRPTDLGFVTADGRVTRGIAVLDIDASRSSTNLYVHGSRSRVTSARLYEADTDRVLAERAGPYTYALGHTAWRLANDLTASMEKTLIRQFTMEEPTANQLTAYLELLLHRASAGVPDAHRSSFDDYRRRLVAKVEAGELRFDHGHGHAIAFSESEMRVDGDVFAVQYSNSYGLPPSLGFRGPWGTRWTGVPLTPTCGGLTVASYGGVTLARSREAVPFEDARNSCERLGGTLASLHSDVDQAFARSLAATGRPLIGLTDREVEGDFRWIDGSVADYTDWASGEPNDSRGEDCVELRDVGVHTQWNDVDCEAPREFVCAL